MSIRFVTALCVLASAWMIPPAPGQEPWAGGDSTDPGAESFDPFAGPEAGSKAPALVGRIEPYEPGSDLWKRMAPLRLRAYWYVGRDGRRIGFLLHVPEDRPETPVHPAVVFLHGLGEAGTDLEALFKQRYAIQLADPDFQRRRSCYIFIPQHPRGSMWYNAHWTDPAPSMALAMEALDWVMDHAHPRIDRSRQYVTGFSSGGRGAMDAATKYPGRFAAVVPISTWYEADGITRKNMSRYWFFYNAGDLAEDIDQLKNFQRHILGMNGVCRLQEYPAGGHDAWTAAYGEARMWTWLFSQSQPLPADQILAARRRTLAIEAVLASVAPAEGSRREAVADGHVATAYRAARPARKEDFVEVIYQTPLECKQVCILTGDADGGRVPAGAAVEISADGLDYRPAGTIRKDRTEILPVTAVKVVRIRMTESAEAPLVVREIELVEPRLPR